MKTLLKNYIKNFSISFILSISFFLISFFTISFILIKKKLLIDKNNELKENIVTLIGKVVENEKINTIIKESSNTNKNIFTYPIKSFSFNDFIVKFKNHTESFQDLNDLQIEYNMIDDPSEEAYLINFFNIKKDIKVYNFKITFSCNFEKTTHLFLAYLNNSMPGIINVSSINIESQDDVSKSLLLFKINRNLIKSDILKNRIKFEIIFSSTISFI